MTPCTPALAEISRAKLGNFMQDQQNELNRIEAAIKCARVLIWSEDWRDAASVLLLTTKERLIAMNSAHDSGNWPREVAE